MGGNKKQKHLSNRVKSRTIVSIVALLCFFSIVFVLIYVINSQIAFISDAQLEKSVNNHLTSSARSAILLVQKNVLEAFIDGESENLPEHKELLERIRQHTTLTNVSKIEIIRKDARNKWIYILDSSLKNHAPCGSEYTVKDYEKSSFNQAISGSRLAVTIKNKTENKMWYSFPYPLMDDNDAVYAIIVATVQEDMLISRIGERDKYSTLLNGLLLILFAVFFFIILKMLDIKNNINAELNKTSLKRLNALIAAKESVFEYYPRAGIMFIDGGFFEETGGLEENNGKRIMAEEFYKYFEDDYIAKLRSITDAITDSITDLKTTKNKKNMDLTESYFEIDMKIKEGIKNNTWYGIKASAMALKKAGKDGDSVVITGIVSNTSDRMNKMNNAFIAAEIDQLTGLASRESFCKKISDYQGRSICFSVYHICLTNLTEMSRTYGSAAADDVLVQFAEFLKKHSDGDREAARIGGEEFMVIYKNVEDKKEGVAFIKHLMSEFTRSALSEKINIYGIYMSAGAAVCPEDANTAGDVLSLAEKAAAEAKKSGRSRVVTYQ